MSLSKDRSSSLLSFIAVGVGTALATWQVQKQLQRAQAKRQRARNDQLSNLAARLRTAMQGKKVLDLRDEASFAEEHIRGSHNISRDSLWNENRWYELPEQHEPLLVLLPPSNTDSHAYLAKEFCDRRASGATSFLIASRDLFLAAQDLCLVESGSSVKQGADPSWTPLFTPSPFLTRAVAELEPQLQHAGLPLACIDIGCGAGRDAVWLAKRGWTVMAVDCWQQALIKTADLARRMGVAESVDARKGKVQKSGELTLCQEHLSMAVYDASQRDIRANFGDTDRGGAFGSTGSTAATLAGGRVAKGDANDGADAGEIGRHEGVVFGAPEFSVSDAGSDSSTVYGLVVAVRFLERNAFDTLAKLVDPRGGYLLLSTFVEEKEPHTRRSMETRNGDDDDADETRIQHGGGASSGRANTRTVFQNATNVTNKGFPSREGAVRSGDRDVGRNSEGGGEGRRRAKLSLKKGAVGAALEAARSAAIMERWPHETPKDANKILRRGELARVFGGRYGFEVLEDSVERLPDGRPVSCFLARRLPLVVSPPSSVGSGTISPWRRGQPETPIHRPGMFKRSPAGGFPEFSLKTPVEWNGGFTVDADVEDGTDLSDVGAEENERVDSLGDMAALWADFESVATGSVTDPSSASPGKS